MLSCPIWLNSQAEALGTKQSQVQCTARLSTRTFGGGWLGLRCCGIPGRQGEYAQAHVSWPAALRLRQAGREVSGAYQGGERLPGVIGGESMVSRRWGKKRAQGTR
jgi:hypothetical protein